MLSPAKLTTTPLGGDLPTWAVLMNTGLEWEASEELRHGLGIYLVL